MSEPVGNPKYLARYAEFRRLLKAARVDAGLSQAQVAKRLKRPQSFVSKAESGERRVDVVELLDWLTVLGVDPIEFVKQLRE